MPIASAAATPRVPAHTSWTARSWPAAPAWRLAALALLIASCHAPAQAEDDVCKPDTIWGKVCGQIQTSNGKNFWSATDGGGLPYTSRTLIGTNGNCGTAATFTLIKAMDDQEVFQLLAPDGVHLLMANGGGGVGKDDDNLLVRTSSEQQDPEDNAFRIVAVSQATEDKANHRVTIRVQILTRKGSGAALTINPQPPTAEELKAQAIGWCDLTVDCTDNIKFTFFKWLHNDGETDDPHAPKSREDSESQTDSPPHNHPNCLNGLIYQNGTCVAPRAVTKPFKKRLPHPKPKPPSHP